MERSKISPKKKLRRPKKVKKADTVSTGTKRKTEKLGKQLSVYQLCIRDLAKPNPIREKCERDARRKSIEPEILMTEGAAIFLGCSVQRLRSISPDELRRIDGPGKGDLFLKEDLIGYARRHPKINPAVDDLMREIEIDDLESSSDSGSRCRGKRRKHDV